MSIMAPFVLVVSTATKINGCRMPVRVKTPQFQLQSKADRCGLHHTFWWIHRDVCLSGRRGACESWPDSVVHASTSVRIRYKFGRCDARLFCMRTLNHSIPATRFYRVMRDRIKYNFTSRCRYCCGGSHPQSPMSAAGIEEQSLGRATRNPERRQEQEQSPRTPRDYRGGWNRNGTNSTDASAATDVSGTKQKTIQTSVLSGLTWR